MWIRPVWATIIVTTLVLTMASVPARADKRVALVIGNAAYQHTRILPNPRNDAEAIAKVLRDIGFEVTVKTDQGYGDFRRAIRDFGQSANGADIAVIHFAGHGLELAGENYLLPVDAKVIRDGDLEYEAVTLTSVLTSVRGATKLRLVILDACRNNPLGDRMALSAGATRAVARGLARIEPSGDVLVAYSAKHGTLAQDGNGPLSPYAEALVKHLATPGMDVRLMFGRVRDDVLAATERRQEPFIYGSLKGDVISFVPSAASDVEATQRELARFATESAAKAKAEEAEARRQAEEATRKRQEAEAEAERLKREAEASQAEAEQQRAAALEVAARARREAEEAKEAVEQQQRELEAERERRQQEDAEQARQWEEARAETDRKSRSLTFQIRSNYAYQVDVSFYASQSSRAWPGGDQVWVISNNEVQTYNLNCIPGEKICYGAWPRGDSSRYWGVGNGGRQGCTRCCWHCGGGDTPVISLN